MRSSFRRRSVAVAVVVVLAVLAGGCGGDDDPSDDGRAEATSTTARDGDGGTATSGDAVGDIDAGGVIDELTAEDVFAVDVAGYDRQSISPEIGLQLISALRANPVVDEAVTSYAGRAFFTGEEPDAVVIAIAYDPASGAAEALRTQLSQGNTAVVEVGGQEVISALDAGGQPSISYVGQGITIWFGGDDQQRVRDVTEKLLTALTA